VRSPTHAGADSAFTANTSLPRKQEATSLLRDPAKGEPLEIQKLIAQATQVIER